MAALAIALVAPAAEPQAPAHEPPHALARFLAHDTTPLTSYRAVRRLEASTRGGRMRGALTAWTELGPGNGFRYEIVSEEGSGQIRGRVLRPALEAEARAHAEGGGPRAALSPTNYAFAPGSVSPDGLLRVSIRPHRNRPMLLDGTMFLRPDDGDLVRVEGRLVKRPSFWTRRVDIVRTYGRVAGVRVPVEMHSTAQVLIVGTSTFAMTWDYESINGIRVGEPGRMLVATTRQTPTR